MKSNGIQYVDLNAYLPPDKQAKTYSKMVKLYANKNKFALEPFSRTIITGESGCGKTTLLTQILINREVKSDYDEIWIIQPTGGVEDCYKKLNHHFQHLKQQLINFEQDLLLKSNPDAEPINPDSIPDIIKFYKSVNDLPKLDDIEVSDDPEQNKHIIVVFDDMISEKKELPLIQEYWTASRKKYLSCVFLTQDYFTVPKVVRRNTTYLFVFRPQNENELDTICRDCSRAPAFKGAVRRLPKYEFILINKNNDNPRLRFRRGFKKPLFKNIS